MALQNVEYTEFTAAMTELRAVGPDVDHSLEDCVCEDFWNQEHTKVVGFIKYWNDGVITHTITNY